MYRRKRKKGVRVAMMKNRSEIKGRKDKSLKKENRKMLQGLEKELKRGHKGRKKKLLKEGNKRKSETEQTESKLKRREKKTRKRM